MRKVRRNFAGSAGRRRITVRMKSSRILSLAFLALPFVALTGVKADHHEAPAVTHCPVSDEELGSMGKAYIHVHQEEGKPDREVPMCCKMCVPRFKSDPAKYLKKMDAEIAAAAEAAAETTAAPEAQS